MNRSLVAAAVCALLCACTDDGTQEACPPQTTTRSVRIEAGTPSSRTELAADGYGVLWRPGDRIGVYVRSGTAFTTINAPLTYEGTEAAAKGLFSGEITLTEGASDYTLYAYYPYDETQTSADAAGISFTLPSIQRQAAAGDSSHLGDSDFLVSGAVQSASGDFAALLFRHAFAVVEVDLTGSAEMAGKRVERVMLFGTDAASVDGSGNLSDMANMSGPFSFDLTASTANNTAAYTGGSAQINYAGVTLTEAPVLGGEARKIYITVNPADYSTGGGRVYVVVRTEDGYTATFSRPGLVISAGQMKVITQDIASGTAPQPEIDLGASETANCYVVDRPAQSYAFDATVAGNGVITPGLQSAVQRFEGRTLSAAVSGTDARLLWQSNPYLIEPGSVRCSGGKIRFTLTGRPTLLGGNAVIALYADAASDEALWSWHIWVSDRSAAELAAAAETYTMYADYEAVYGAGGAVMMDRNLGAVTREDGPYARSFRAPLYQWGRKDPFPWGHVVFDAENNPRRFILEHTPVQSTGAPGSYAGYTGNTWYATAHPDTFIATTDASSYDWYWGGGKGVSPDFRNNELWGNPTGYEVGQTTAKTLFDPCPPGWKMPHPYVFSAFTATGGNATVSSGEAHVSGRFEQGWNLIYNGSATTYYPGVGYRYDEAGVFLFSSWCYYWSSSPASDSAFGTWAFMITPTQIWTQFINPRGSGFPVRCMKE